MIKTRGAIVLEECLEQIKAKKTSFIAKQKLCFSLSYVTDTYQLHVVDRFASFPLYYLIHDRKLVVSEVASDLIPYLSATELDPVGYSSMGGQWSLVRTKHTPIKGISRLMPGHYLQYNNGDISIVKYWSFNDLKERTFEGSFEDACDELHFLISQSIQRHLAFAPNATVHLSGGQDSGAISALVCEYSTQDRIAYARVHSKEVIANGLWESNIIHLFQQQYPALKLKYGFELKSVSQANFDEIDNWFHVSSEDIQCQIAQDVPSHNTNYVLTGMGGDELASYGFGFQNQSYLVNNDWQAKLHFNSKLQFKKKRTQFLKVLLSDRGSFRGSFKFVRDMFDSSNKFYWYSKEQNRACKDILKIPPSNPIIYPASTQYRLDLLERSFFTYRADLWNYIGRKFGVNYLHPLLDADIVDFCAILPPSFFAKNKPRQLFKTAMEKSIPAELLVGGKRPVYGIGQTEHALTDLMKDVKRLSSLAFDLQGSNANSVYDFFKIQKALNEIQSVLSKSKSNQFARLRIFRAILKNIHDICTKHTPYLNNYF